MLPEQRVKVRWHTKNKDLLERYGYQFTGFNDFVEVEAKHLMPGSHTKIRVICDYCGGEYFPIYKDYLRVAEQSIIKKDACVKCSVIKKRQSNLQVHGVECVWNKPENREISRVAKKMRASEAESILAAKGYISLGELPERIDALSKISFMCTRHPEAGEQLIQCCYLKKWIGCKVCRVERYTGANHYNWKGGTSRITMFLRASIQQWRIDSAKACKGRCIITGRVGDTIHHLYSFHGIVEEVFSELGIPYRDTVNEYSQNELDALSAKCLEIHYRYPLGVCLAEDVHREFHHRNGQDATLEQFEQFRQNYKVPAPMKSLAYNPVQLSLW
jgi:hypothetical protein